MGNTATVWDLDADPKKLTAFEDGWKAQAEKLSWAADTINGAANRVVGRRWQGPAAERYNGHRRKLVGDLDECAELAGKAARAVGECIQVLEFNQGLLNNEKAKVTAKVPSQAGLSGRVDFYPEDDAQTKLVNELVQTYEEIRGRVDEKLNPHIAVFTAATSRLQAWERTWGARTLRMLNWNIQQGGDGNRFWDEQGTQQEDFATLAKRLIDGKVDIATLQEVFKNGADKLQQELDKLEPGQWQVHFGPGSEKGQMEQFGLENDFGNVVAVRTGNGVTTDGTSVTDLGPGDEGRSTTKVRVNLDR
ncbi:hypothetical protein [Nocardia sp. NPDC049149]|uniref:hypothetical protein n=1 Tax=Nocardia sp. NPDC049149 TaxID=3364315 RepID=UPI00371F420D